MFSPLPSPTHLLLHHRQAPRWSGEWAATNSLVQHGETPFSTPIPAPRCTPTATHSRRGSGVLEITLRTSGGVVLGRLGRYPQGTAKPDTENDPKCSPPLRGSGRGWKQGGRFPLHALAGGLPLPTSVVIDVGGVGRVGWDGVGVGHEMGCGGVEWRIGRVRLPLSAPGWVVVAEGGGLMVVVLGH